LIKQKNITEPEKKISFFSGFSLVSRPLAYLPPTFVPKKSFVKDLKTMGAAKHWKCA